MLLTALIIACQEKPAATQVWEKLLAPGVTYRMEVDPNVPLLIHAVRVTPQAEGLLVAGELGTGKTFDANSPLNGREAIADTARRTGSLVAINADFFPFTGDPLGAMVRAGELLSAPYKGRAAFAWGAGYAQAVYLDFSATMRYENAIIEVKGLNQECGDDMVVLQTPAAGAATSAKPATHAIVQFDATIAPAGLYKARVLRVVRDATKVVLAPGEGALSFSGSFQQQLQFLSTGDEFDVRVTCTGADWAKATNVIGGGPFLVKDGKPFVPYQAEGFTDGFAKNKHPRTAIGRSRNGDIWIVVVDGRQTASAGMALTDLADYFVKLGCYEAINLDGGGSTTLNLAGLTVNRPSEGSERPVANALLVFSGSTAPPSPPENGIAPVIAGPATLKTGEQARYRMVDPSGADLPSTEVLWSAQGAGWIDQSGRVTATTEGAVRIKATSKGLVASLVVEVSKG